MTLTWTSVLNLKVVQKDGQQVRWVGDDWAFPEVDEVLVLRVPLHPPQAAGADAKKYAVALADYYNACPSIFGTPNTGNIKTGGVVSSGASAGAATIFKSMTIKLNPALQRVFAHAMSPAGSGVLFANQESLPHGFTPSALSFFDLGVVLNYVMAKAWGNAAYRHLVQVPQDTVPSFRTDHGFTPPWAIPLVIRDHAKAESKRERSKPHTRRGPQITIWCSTCRSIRKRNRDWGVALAAYNSTGAQFPFTCCP